VSRLLERFAGYFPALVALALPIVVIPTLSDLYILPRASIVIAGACLGTGLALLLPTERRLGALRWPLLAAAIAALLAFSFSVNWGLSLAGSYTRYESLPIRLSYVGLLVTAAWLVRTERQRGAVVAAYVFGCSVASIEGLQQAFSHVAFRPDGNLGNANLLAAMLVLAIPLAIDRTLHANWWSVPAWAGAIVIMAAGLFVTTSRSGFLGAGVACLVLLIFSVRTRLAGITALVSASIGAAALAYVYTSPLRRLNDDPPELRLHLWGDALHLIAARPLTGWGEDTTGLTFGRYLSRDYATLVTFDRIHSGPLDVAATQGIVGLAATGLVVAIVFVYAWRSRSEPMVPGLAAALAGYSVWVLFNFDWAPATGAFWLLAGCEWSASQTPLPSAEMEGERGVQRSLRALAASALVVATVVLAVLPILADSWYARGRADLAVRADPLQAQYHWAIGTVAELRRAASLGETEPSMYVLLGDLERNMGNIDAAHRDFERALEIDPYFYPASADLQALPNAPPPP
jgi:O-antigen ligase